MPSWLMQPPVVAAIVVVCFLCWLALLVRVWHRRPASLPRLRFPEVEHIGERQPLFADDAGPWRFPLFYLKHCRRPYDQEIDGTPQTARRAAEPPTARLVSGDSIASSVNDRDHS